MCQWTSSVPIRSRAENDKVSQTVVFLYWPTHFEVKGFIMLRHFLSVEKHKHLQCGILLFG